jgi:hypothetical protein
MTLVGISAALWGIYNWIEFSTLQKVETAAGNDDIFSFIYFLIKALAKTSTLFVLGLVATIFSILEAIWMSILAWAVSPFGLDCEWHNRGALEEPYFWRMHCK